MTTYSNLKYDHPFSSNATGTGALTKISSQTASGTSTIDFTSNIDSSYKEYIFKFINCHLSNDSAVLALQFSSDGGSNYGITKTTTNFVAYHNEAGTNSSLEYDGGSDRAQSTSGFSLNSLGVSNADDAVTSGYMSLFEPSSTTFVKHFIIRSASLSSNTGGECVDNYIAGYLNTTSAINGVRFYSNVGTIDSGTIIMYGVS